MKYLFYINIKFYFIQLSKFRFDYILDQLGKRNIFALLCTIGLEENVYDVCEILLNIQTKKRYEKNSSNFHNIYKIIKGVIEDSNISMQTLSLILMRLNKKEKKEIYDLVYYSLTEMKNILANPINQLIFKIIKYDLDSNDNKSKIKKTNKVKKSIASIKLNNNNYKEDYSNIEIFNIKDDKFLFLLKKLSNISHEYLVNFYSSLPLNDNFTEVKIKGITYFEILSKLIKSKNSISIAENYEMVFNFFTNIIYKRNTRDIDKFKIFTTLIKFNYKNPKERLKKSGLKNSTYNIIYKFVDEIKNESIILSVLNFVENKYLKGKKISNKIVEHLISKFSKLKNKKIYETLVQQNLKIIKKKLLLNSSNFDLISNDYRRKIEKTGFFLKESLIKFSEYEENLEYTNIFELNFMKFLLNTIQRLTIRKNFDYEGNLEAFLKLFYISSFENRSYNILLKYFISCGEANKKMKKFLLNMSSLKNKNNISLDQNSSELNHDMIQNNRFFDRNNLNLFDKIEILFYNRIKLNSALPYESEPTGILIDDSSKEKLKNCFLNLFCFQNSENFTLQKRLEHLETIVSFAEDKLANNLKRIFLLKKFNNLNSKASKTKSKFDIIDLIEKDDYSSQEEEEKEFSDPDNNYKKESKRSKNMKNSKRINEITELNLDINHRYKFTVEDIVYIFKAFIFELETENISFLEPLGDLFIYDIEFPNSKGKNTDLDINQNTDNFDEEENFSNVHLLSLLKAILTTYYFYIKNITININSENKQNNLLNEKDISKYSFLQSEAKNETTNKTINDRESLINQMDISANNKTILDIENKDKNRLLEMFHINQSKIKIDNIKDLSLFIKNHLFSIFHFLKKILINNINQEDIVNLIIIISKNLYSLDDETIKLEIFNFVKRELTNFCFESSENSVKSLADFFLKMNKGETFYYIPERFEYYLKSEKYNLTSLKFINYLIKLEFENQEFMQKLKNSASNFKNLEKLRCLIFKEDLVEYLENELIKFLISIDYKKEILTFDINNNQKRNTLAKKFKRIIMLKNEIYKFYLNYLIFAESISKKKNEETLIGEEISKSNNEDKTDKTNKNEKDKIEKINKFIKGIFSNINDLLDADNILFNVKNNKLILNEKTEIVLHTNEQSIDDSSQSDYDNSELVNISKLNLKDVDLIKKHKITEKDLQIKNNFINQFRIIEICKNISLIFLFVDLKQNIDLKSQIRLSNLALNKELLVRSYLLKKIEKILLRKNSIYQYLNLIQILVLYLNEPNKELNKKALDIFGKFIDFICKKFNQYKHLINGDSKTYFYYYKYIPETYITYLIMYVVFNPNLITLVQLNEKKYFQDLIKKFMKIIKKNTNVNYDSSFMLGILIQIKDLELINTKNKFISLISTNNYNTYLDNNNGKNKVSVLNQISIDYKSIISQFNFQTYNQTKNLICDLAMDIIKLNFDTKIKYENVKPLIPIIFYTKEYINKNNLSLNFNNFNLYNLLNTTNNFSLLNGINLDNNNFNTTDANIFRKLEGYEVESKGKPNYIENNNSNNRLTLENFVKKNTKINNNLNINDKISMFDKNKLNNQDDNYSNLSNEEKNNNLKKKVKSEIENENELDIEEDEMQDLGNFEIKEKRNKKGENNKKKTKIKNAPLKLYVDDDKDENKIEKLIDDKEQSIADESEDELEILPYYNKYKNKQKYKGVLADQESFSYKNIGNSSDENDKNELKTDEDIGNFDNDRVKNEKKDKKANNKGKKKADKQDDSYNNNNNKKKKKKVK